MSGADEAPPGRRVTVTLNLDEAAAVALATVIRRVTEHDFALRGPDLEEWDTRVQAWSRAYDALSPQLPDDVKPRFEREEREYRAARERAAARD